MAHVLRDHHNQATEMENDSAVFKLLAPGHEIIKENGTDTDAWRRPYLGFLRNHIFISPETFPHLQSVLLNGISNNWFRNHFIHLKRDSLGSFFLKEHHSIRFLIIFD